VEPVYLSAIEYVVGDNEPIESIPELKEQGEFVETLKALGLDRYNRSDAGPAALAAEAACKTLGRAGLAPDDVDLVLYCTTSFQDSANYRQGLHQFTARTGLSHAYILGQSLSECANVNAAIKTASEMLQNPQYSNVLVVSADAVHPSQSRVVPPSISIKSDGAVAFLMTKAAGRYRVVDSHWNRGRAFWGMDPSREIQPYMQMVSEGIEANVAAILARNGLAIADVKKVVTNNYNRSVLRTFSFKIGVKENGFFWENVAVNAHVVAGDTLINLKQHSLKPESVAGEKILLLGSGPYMWVTNLLEKC
jgi:3-oxoacyl-[acyl-carrier-protein] synthase-3